MDCCIVSTPINICSKFIVVFIIFGAFLERTGIADFFIKITNSVVGGFSDGPAKVAVVASALEGMVPGSSVANTVGSGSVTIPLMKNTGYKPEFAAAAEASASTVGQIISPIMGAASIAILAAIFVSLFNKENRITPKRIWEALASGGQGMIAVAAACGVAGIVAGLF